MPMNLKLADVAVGTLQPLRRARGHNGVVSYKDGQPVHGWEDLDRRVLFLDRLHDRKKDWKSGQITQGLFQRAVEIPEEVDMYHRNFMEYLEKCWGAHLGIVVTPDILWFTVLSELVGVVKDGVETYRHLFTDSHEKKDIVVVTQEPEVMPLNQLVGALRQHVPTESTLFMPEFSTTTSAARHAMYASFCDLCSPYYNYSMLACAFPAISIQGSEDDWQRLSAQWSKLKPLFKAAGHWVDRVGEILAGCHNNREDAQWWQNMFKLERCGSGSQTEVSGWFSELFRVPPQGPAYVSNFPTNVAKVEYKQLNTAREFVMQDGLFCSRREGDFMFPEFGYTVHEKLKVEPEPYDSRGTTEDQEAAMDRFLARTKSL